MFWVRNKKNNFQLRTLIWSTVLTCDLSNSFENSEDPNQLASAKTVDQDRLCLPCSMSTYNNKWNPATQLSGIHPNQQFFSRGGLNQY